MGAQGEELSAAWEWRDGGRERVEGEKVRVLIHLYTCLSNRAHMCFYWAQFINRDGPYKASASENRGINRGGHFNGDRLG